VVSQRVAIEDFGHVYRANDKFQGYTATDPPVGRSEGVYGERLRSLRPVKPANAAGAISSDTGPSAAAKRSVI